MEPGRRDLGDETVFLIFLFRRRFGFALFALGQGLVLTAAAEFFEGAFSLDLGLEAFESAVDGLSFFNGDFGHEWVLGQDNG